MARSTHGIAAALLLVGFTAPALAQFGSIFGLPPRPPREVPSYPVDPRLPQEPRYERDYDRSWREPYYDREQREPPPPPLTRLPRRQQPPQPQSPQQPQQPPAEVQTQPLPPPPGATAAPPPEQAARPPLKGPGKPPLVGLPPGQRQPRGTPQPEGGQTENAVVIPPPKEHIENPTATFAGLDKITGRIISFDVAIGETVQFGALRLTPRACYTRPPTEPPNTDGFVEVDEITLKGEVKRIFTGWMFAASPGLHGVEHPIYDVWLTDCKKSPPQIAGAGQAAQPASQATAAAPAASAPQAAPAPPKNPPSPPPRPR